MNDTSAPSQPAPDPAPKAPKPEPPADNSGFKMTTVRNGTTPRDTRRRG